VKRRSFLQGLLALLGARWAPTLPAPPVHDIWVYNAPVVSETLSLRWMVKGFEITKDDYKAFDRPELRAALAGLGIYPEDDA